MFVLFPSLAGSYSFLCSVGMLNANRMTRSSLVLSAWSVAVRVSPTNVHRLAQTTIVLHRHSNNPMIVVLSDSSSRSRGNCMNWLHSPLTSSTSVTAQISRIIPGATVFKCLAFTTNPITIISTVFPSMFKQANLSTFARNTWWECHRYHSPLTPHHRAHQHHHHHHGTASTRVHRRSNRFPLLSCYIASSRTGTRSNQHFHQTFN